MQNLWKWLMHANAKFALAVALCVLLAAAAWSAWQLATASSAANDFPAVPVTTEPAPKSKTPKSIGLLDYVHGQLADESIPPVNPFAPSLAIDNIAEIIKRREIREEGRGFTWNPRRNNQDPNNPQNPNVTAVSKVPEAAKSAPPTLTYQGYLTRPDGTPAALIHNSATKSAAFLTAGQTTAKTTVISLTHDTLRLRLPNGEERELAFRESITIE